MAEFAKLHEYLPTDVSATLGAKAVQAAYEVENIQGDLAVTRHNQHLAEELIEKGVPNPATTGKFTRLLRRLRGKPYSSKDDVARVGQWVEDNGMAYLAWTPIRLKAHADNLVSTLEEAEVIKEAELRKVRTKLSKYHEPHKKELDELWGSEELGVPDIFKRAKAEAAKGGELGWVDWLESHADDQTLINVLEWGAHKVEEECATPEFKAKVDRIKQGYAKGLDVAYQDGLLDDFGWQFARTRLEEIQIKTFHPLSEVRADPSAVGAATQGDGYVEIRPDTSDFSGYHEVTHEIFGTTSRVFDEATTELATEYLYEKGSGKAADSSGPYYEDDIPGLRNLLHIAGMDEKEWLQYALDPSMEGLDKTLILDQIIAQRTGFHLLVFAEKDFNRYISWAIAKFGAAALHGARQVVYRDIANLRQLFEGVDRPATLKALEAKLVQDARAGRIEMKAGAKLLDIILDYNPQALEEQIQQSREGNT